MEPNQPQMIPELTYIAPENLFLELEDEELIYENIEESDEAYQNYHEFISKNEFSDTLQGVFQEIMDIEEKYSQTFLESMHVDLSNASSMPEYLFFLHIQNIRVDLLIDLHKQLRKELIDAKDCIEDGTMFKIPDIFVRFKSDFLVYTDVITKCNLLLKSDTFTDKINLDLKSLLLVPTMEDGSRWQKNFDVLLKFPFVHLCNYLNLMMKVIKETRKEIKLKGTSQQLENLMESAKAAHQAIHEVLLYTQSFVAEDTETIWRTASKISNESPILRKSLTTDYGKLLYEFQARCKPWKASKFERSICLCFHCGIFVFLDQPSKTSAKQGLEFICFVAISTTDEVHIRQGDPNYIIMLKVSSKFSSEEKLSEGKSLEIQLKHEYEANETFLKLSKCYPKDQYHPGLSSSHRDHIYHWINYNPIASGNQPRICSLCDIYLFGRLSVGFHCKTCNLNYHTECFINGRTPLNFYANTVGADPPEFSIESMMGKRGDSKALELKDVGTFFVYSKKNPKIDSSKKAEYRLMRKKFDERAKEVSVVTHRITSYKTESKKEVFYWEKFNRGFPSIPELVKHFQVRYKNNQNLPEDYFD